MTVTVNGSARELAKGCTVAQLVAAEGVPERGIAVLCIPACLHGCVASIGTVSPPESDVTSSGQAARSISPMIAKVSPSGDRRRWPIWRTSRPPPAGSARES